MEFGVVKDEDRYKALFEYLMGELEQMKNYLERSPEPVEIIADNLYYKLKEILELRKHGV